MPHEPLVIEESLDSQNRYRILQLRGPITISNLFDLQARVRSNTLPGLILDLGQVPYIDSAGIGALVGAHVNHQKDGRSLALVGVTERVRNALQITRVESFFRFFDSLDAAAAA